MYTPALSIRLRLCRSTLGTTAVVDVGYNPPDRFHLKIDDAIELKASDTQITPGLTKTTLGADERGVANVVGQLSYLHANPLGHRPALM
jgi:hypothetical protein